MARTAVLGVDIGTSSSKGVLVALDGGIVAQTAREHTVDRPHSGHVEMGGGIWWEEFVSISRELTGDDGIDVVAVGVSGMGPCVLLTDAAGEPVRPAILYGVDSRAGAQIDRITREFGADDILKRCGSLLTSQAAGPKIAWIAENEPDAYARAERLFMPSSFLAWHLTGQYLLDFHSASQCTPLFDRQSLAWYRPWSDAVARGIDLPPLRWPGEIAGTVTDAAADATGLPSGIPVITGTIDAWSEAISVGAQNTGDLMLMYGTTMFLINTVDAPVTAESMWGTVGAIEGTSNLAGGMATSGAITSWLRDLTGSADYPTLLAEAAASGVGARGLLMLPYFAGERTPIMDPDARGMIAGLTLGHSRGDLYRAALEATALGVRHNVETMNEAGADIQRVVAAGGGTQGSLWTQIVTDVTGLTQLVPSITIGASYGAAFLAAGLVAEVSIEQWNPPSITLTPDPLTSRDYDELYRLYRELYTSTRGIAHALADRQRSAP